MKDKTERAVEKWGNEKLEIRKREEMEMSAERKRSTREMKE